MCKSSSYKGLLWTLSISYSGFHRKQALRATEYEGGIGAHRISGRSRTVKK